MIGYLNGKVKKFSGQKAIIECGGVGYEVYWAGKALAKGDSAEIWVHTHITERSTTLYGFEDEKSKRGFTALLKVSGVGPKSAFSIIATLGPSGAREAISSGSVDALSTAPGVGKKLARRIITELKDDVSFSDEEESIYSEAAEALVDLGYRSSQVRPKLIEIEKEGKDWKLGELIKEAMRRMSK